MSGIAAVFKSTDERLSKSDFQEFLQRMTNAKRLMLAPTIVSGCGCRAAKFDTASSLHRGVTIDAPTGSWLIAAGTVIDPPASLLDGDLSTLLQDYLKHGATVFQRLDGVFALTLYNGRTRTLSIVSDPFGYFSIFYGERDNCTWVGTAALSVAQLIHATPSELGVQCFFEDGPSLWGNDLVESSQTAAPGNRPRVERRWQKGIYLLDTGY